MPRNSKAQLVDALIAAFRANGNQDDAFDNLAAKRLGVNRTDLHCLNTIENAGGLTAGRLATEVQARVVTHVEGTAGTPAAAVPLA